MDLTNNRTVLDWIDQQVKLTKPDQIVWVDGSESQLEELRAESCATGEMIKLNQEKMPGCYLHRSDPSDVARVESRTFICCKKQEDAGPTNNWMDPEEMYAKLAKLYDGSVHYITLSKPDTCYVPREDVVYGSGSRITFINPSVGGWTSADGVTNFSSYLAPYIRQYGCDLFVLDLGGNDGSAPAENTRRNDEKIMDSVLELAPDTSAIIMTTLLNNVEATNGWAGGEYMQEPLLVKSAEQYRRRGVPCACCQFNGTHRALLQKINYRDVSGNNVNHPNDFLCRVYAGTLIQTVLGYENFD